MDKYLQRELLLLWLMFWNKRRTLTWNYLTGKENAIRIYIIKSFLISRMNELREREYFIDTFHISLLKKYLSYTWRWITSSIAFKYVNSKRNWYLNLFRYRCNSQCLYGKWSMLGFTKTEQQLLEAVASRVPKLLLLTLFIIRKINFELIS